MSLLLIRRPVILQPFALWFPLDVSGNFEGAFKQGSQEFILFFSSLFFFFFLKANLLFFNILLLACAFH